MQGYVTEKIFDCFYAGTIPLYLGASDIPELIPKEAFIDCRQFSSWAKMADEMLRLPNEEIQSLRAIGRSFVRGEKNFKYYESLIELMDE